MRKYSIWVLFTLIVASCSTKPSVSPQNTPSNSPDQKNSSADPEAIRHFMDGQLYMNQGDYAMAIIEFQDALRFDPEVSTIHVSLGECFWYLGKAERALYHLEKAIQADPNDNEAREIMANQFIMRKMFDKAMEQYTILTELNPGNSEYFVALADLTKLQHQFEKAIRYYQQAFEINPRNLDILEKAVEITLNIKDFKLAQQLFKELIDADETNLRYLESYKDIAVMNRDPEAGLWALNRLIKLKGHSPEILNQAGLLHYEFDQIDSALTIFNQVFQLDSLNITALHFISTIYREKDDDEKALHFSKRLIRHYPEDPRGYINTALVSLNKEDPGAAITVLSGPAERFPKDFTIQYLLGMSYNLTDDNKMAELYLKRAVDINPRLRNAWHTLAIIYDNSQRWSESDSVYEHLISTDSTDAQAYNNYAYSLVERGEKLELALSMSRKAISLSPGSSAYLDTFGWIHFKLGNLDSALTYIKQSVDIEDTNAVVLEHLGDVLLKMDNYKEANHYFHKALELNPDNSTLKEKIGEK